jgi:hypothetical protein
LLIFTGEDPTMRQITYKIGAYLFLFLVFTGAAEGAGRDNSTASASRVISAAEKSLMRSLALKEDANDAEIIELLNDPRKRIFAAGLIRCRRIKGANDKLLELVGDDKADVFTRIAAAEALCDLDCGDWIPAINLC